MFLNNVLSRLKPKDLTITAVGTKSSQVKSSQVKRASLYLFAPQAVMCKYCRTQWKNYSYTETETRCAAQKPLLIEERTTYAFSMD